MVNRSIAHQLLGDEADEDGSWIIVYDFIEHKPNPNFWVNLKRKRLTRRRPDTVQRLQDRKPQ